MATRERTPQVVQFQLLLRNAGGEVPPAAEAATTASVVRYRPDPAAAPAVIAWLAKEGVTAHDAGFAVAASAAASTFARLFGKPPAAPRVPDELAPWVTAIEPSRPPEFFR